MFISFRREGTQSERTQSRTHEHAATGADAPSHDDSKMVFENYNNITYIYNKKNIGFGCANNICVRKASGFHARVVQHELDHLDGVLFPLRIKEKDMRSFGFTEAVMASSVFLQSRQES